MTKLKNLSICEAMKWLLGVEVPYPSFSELFGQKKKQNDEKKDGE